ncbi:preprotein translocase subunit YajC [Clostridium moniliforme]|uniref:Preprotein translocase subunit YajC n=1 Tax=Clostridium moniliforme TaxID=39489 RepID=A0ABS4F1W5_9CLOT|nr:preprotein translocase subunit YajC [Clostridium moniliforme]MBP1890221.1 preprotein translocase subunit YajC [Clostridium moniliforme]
MKDAIIIGFMLTVLLYFLYNTIIFPSINQKKFIKQQKNMKDFQDGLKVSDNVLTMSGMYGVIVKINKNIVSLKISPDVVVKIDKSTVVGMSKEKIF